MQSGSRIVPGAGCARVSDTAVRCLVTGITRIVLNGGDLNDTLNASTIPIRVTLNGGDGNDTLTGGPAGDTLTGGLGRDRFRAGGGNDVINAPRTTSIWSSPVVRRRRHRYGQRGPVAGRTCGGQRQQLRDGPQALTDPARSSSADGTQYERRGDPPRRLSLRLR